MWSPRSPGSRTSPHFRTPITPPSTARVPRACTRGDGCQSWGVVQRHSQGGQHQGRLQEADHLGWSPLRRMGATSPIDSAGTRTCHHGSTAEGGPGKGVGDEARQRAASLVVRQEAPAAARPVIPFPRESAHQPLPPSKHIARPSRPWAGARPLLLLLLQQLPAPYRALEGPPRGWGTHSNR